MEIRKEKLLLWSWSTQCCCKRNEKHLYWFQL